MDSRRFDSLVRSLADPTWSRRRLSRALVGGSVAALFGWNDREPAARKKRRKKKKPTNCTPDCAGKSCGNSNGCGGKCTTQQGCGAGETCVNGQCSQNNCNPACTGNYLCQNGSCVCPRGLKECVTGGTPGNCHECCDRGAFEPPPSGPNPDCAGNPDGQYCTRPTGSINTCGCLWPMSENCGDGICAECCTHQQCQTKYEDEFRFCIGGACRCDEAAGYILCPEGPARNLCRHISDDANACGPTCVDCGQDEHGCQCENGGCCIGPGHACVPAEPQCCGGRQCVNVGTVQFPNFVCG